MGAAMGSANMGAAKIPLDAQQKEMLRRPLMPGPSPRDPAAMPSNGQVVEIIAATMRAVFDELNALEARIQVVLGPANAMEDMPRIPALSSLGEALSGMHYDLKQIERRIVDLSRRVTL